MRFFTTVGPVNCADHYCLPPLPRLDMDDVMALIAQKILFAARAAAAGQDERHWQATG